MTTPRQVGFRLALTIVTAAIASEPIAVDHLAGAQAAGGSPWHPIRRSAGCSTW